MLDLTYLYAHKGKAVRSYGFDEIFDEEKIENRLWEMGSSSPPSPYPLVVWRCTRACNLNCIHCYSNATPYPVLREMSTEEGEKMIDDLAGSGVSEIIFSGGEPLLRKDLFELARYAKSKEMEAVLSTNGTWITKEVALKLKVVGFSYISIGMAGLDQANDYFRGKEGSFQQTVRGVEECQKAGLQVVLRVNLTRHNILHLPNLFKFIEDHGIGTVSFFHLFPFGRGMEMVEPSLEETHRAADKILAATRKLNEDDRYVQIFLAGNVCDGAYVYKVLIDHEDPRAGRIRDYLIEDIDRFGTAGSEGLCIDWNGDVHPNQFWLDKTMGNVRTEKFLDIIGRNLGKKPTGFPSWECHLRHRCAKCRYVSLCMSGFQPAVLSDEALADAYPKCYLTDAEITY